MTMETAIFNDPPAVPPTAAPSLPAKTDTITPAAAGDLGKQWPMLGAAMAQYERTVAEHFMEMAYDRVTAGLIRLDDRRTLAAEAESLGIQPFDAQLLIACAIRKWAIDRRYDASPNPSAPRLSWEYKAWGRAWIRFALVTGTALALDAILLYFWLGGSHL